MSDFMCFSWGIEVAGAYLFVGNHVFILKNKLRSWLGNNFYCYRRFRFDPGGRALYSTFHAAKCRTYSPDPSLPPLFPFSSVPLFSFFFPFFFFPGSSILSPLYFFRVASLFIDNNNVHFTVWFWDIQGGARVRGPWGGPPAPRCSVVSLCKWCSWHSCLWN